MGEKPITVLIVVVYFFISQLIFPASNCFTFYDTEKSFHNYLWDEVISNKDRPKVALVLGGGGARGMAHIGVLKVFEEENIPVDIIVGTSVGALIGGLYASGIGIEKIEKLAEDIGWGKLTNMSATNLIELLVAEKLLSTEKMERYIKEQIGGKNFYELKIPFACVATDIQTGERIIFREGKVALAVRASATIPGIFNPVEYRHRLLVDGGVVDNIPVDVAKLLGADIVIAVSVKADFTDYSTSNILLVLNQVIYIQGEQVVMERLKNADFIIEPKVADVNAMDLGRGGECVNAGIIVSRKNVIKIKNKILEKSFDSLYTSMLK